MSRIRFTTLGVVTIAAVYFLILVGGIVRVSGSGIGCPDWPKCFGRWVQPAAESQLPVDYKEAAAPGGRLTAAGGASAEA